MTTPVSVAEFAETLSDEARRQRMRNAVKSLAVYMAIYADQPSYEDYTDSIFIDDVLYGLGVALQPEEYRFAGGYARFKERLKKHLNR